MRIGSLFSGYGGLDMAVQQVLGGDLVWVSDIDPGACKILAHRHPDVPNLGDITTVDWATVEPVDVLTGGFPCQDVSHAGRRRGLIRGETRTGLWANMLAAIDQLRPSLVVAENVKGLLSARADSDVEPCPWCLGDDTDGAMRALGAVLADLADVGYDARWCGLRAADVGAPHGRFRVFIAAHPNEAGLQGLRGAPGASPAERHGHAVAGAGGPDMTLLPTPAANLGSNGGPQDPAKRRAGGHSVSIEDAIHGLNLLPTPRATCGGSASETMYGLGGQLSTDGRTQGEVLLQTPAVADATGSHKMRGGARNAERLLPGQAEDMAAGWGAYEGAVRRWESTFRPAPSPVEPKANGTGHRLSPRFTEWMMGLPEGHITDVPGVTRAEALKACGNGVVPQQAAAALRHMLGGAA